MTGAPRVITARVQGYHDRAAGLTDRFAAAAMAARRAADGTGAKVRMGGEGAREASSRKKEGPRVGGILGGGGAMD